MLKLGHRVRLYLPNRKHRTKISDSQGTKLSQKGGIRHTNRKCLYLVTPIAHCPGKMKIYL